MKIAIESNIIRYCLRNVYFINGTAYAGKSTMVKMLADKHDMICCGENYHDALAGRVKTVEAQPNLCYFETMSGWEEFVSRSPDAYDRWIRDSSREAAEIEIAELLGLAASGRKIIVDTNIPPDILHEIADNNHVAIMLSPQSMSVERFFDREDADKQFIFKVIQGCPNPRKTMENYKACIAKINSREHYDEFANSGFFTLVREDCERDTREEVLAALEKHFGLCG